MAMFFNLVLLYFTTMIVVSCSTSEDGVDQGIQVATCKEVNGWILVYKKLR